MRFFVPGTPDKSQGEAKYQEICAAMMPKVGPLTERRIQGLRFNKDNKSVRLSVGDSFHSVHDEPVLAILEGNENFYICTSRHNGLLEEPISVPRDAAQLVEEFTALA